MRSGDSPGRSSLFPRFLTGVMLLLFSFLALPLDQVQAQGYFYLQQKKKQVTIPFTLHRNLIVVKAQLNGYGPYNFLLDTGVSTALITNPRLLDSLGVVPGAEIRIAGAGSSLEDLKAYMVNNVVVELPGATAPKLSMTFLSEDVFNLSSYVGMPIAGLLGYQFFNSFVVRIDFNSQQLTLYQPETFKYRKRDGIAIPFELEGQRPYLYALTTLAGEPAISTRLILDTGAGHALSLEQESHSGIKVPVPALRTQLGTGLSGSIMGYVGRIPQFQLNKFVFKNMLTSFPDHADVAAKVQVGRNGNLGNEVLKRFNLVVDYSRSRLSLRPNSRLKEPFEHDMCGVEIVASGAGYNRYMIVRVDPGSPAEEADLQPGDEILFVDNTSASSLSLSKLDRYFRLRDGYRLTLVLSRQQQLIFRFVTLRRKI
ncbi:MAG: aspartyl protease family protein [Adhaeribacter sp.]